MSFSSDFSSDFDVGSTIWPISCTIIGAGSVTATARLRAAASSNINGVGSVTAVARLRANTSATIAGQGAVTAQAHGTYIVAANIAGTGLVASDFNVVGTEILVNVAGQGSVTAHANVIANAYAQIFGNGFVVVHSQTGQVTPPAGGGSQFLPDLLGATNTPTVDEYVDLIPGYNATQPKFISTLRAVLNPIATLTAFTSTVPDRFDLDKAIGSQLDQVGLWIGRNRSIQVPISNVYFSWDIDNLGWEQGFWQGAFDPDDGITQLDDGTYRALLYAKAMSNVWDSSPEAVGDMLNVLLHDQGVSAVVVDNQDMSMNVQVIGGLENLVFRALLQGGYLPIKPEGVSITYTIPDFVPSQTSAAAITGFGSVTAHANLIQNASAFIQGQGSVTANAQGGSGAGNFNASATLGGAGSVAGTARVIALATPNIISGTGFVTANAQGRKLGSATIIGQGSVHADSQVLVASTQTWSTTLRNTWIALSNQNFTGAKNGNDGIYSACGPKIFKTSNKWYWEVLFPAENGDVAAGICNPSMSIADDYYLGEDTNSYGVYPNADPTNTLDFYNNLTQSAPGTIPYFSAGVVGRFALDCDNWKLWTAAGSGPWGGTAGGDPATNVGGWPIPATLQTGGVGPAFVLANVLDSIVAHFKSSDWAFPTPPTGFGAM